MNVGDVYVAPIQFKALDLTVLPTQSYAYTAPTTVTVSARAPSGATTTYSLAGGTVWPVPGTVGIYYAQIPCNEAGVWHLSCTSTGPAAGAEQHEFLVRA